MFNYTLKTWLPFLIPIVENADRVLAKAIFDGENEEDILGLQELQMEQACVLRWGRLSYHLDSLPARTFM